MDKRSLLGQGHKWPCPFVLIKTVKIRYLKMDWNPHSPNLLLPQDILRPNNGIRNIFCWIFCFLIQQQESLLERIVIL